MHKLLQKPALALGAVLLSATLAGCGTLGTTASIGSAVVAVRPLSQPIAATATPVGGQISDTNAPR